MENYFAFKTEEYERVLNPLDSYVKMQSFYLNKMTGKPIEKCYQFIVNNLKPDGAFPLKDKSVRFLSRENKDRVRAMTTILKYIGYARENNYLISPSWTVYYPKHIRPSLYTGYINYESGVRSAYKKAMFIAEQRNDKAKIMFNDGMQSSAKIGINSISGGALDPYTNNHCQSLHPTLTATCGASTSYANLNNEKLLMGNRNYKTYQDTLDNMVVIAMTANYDNLQRAMTAYDLHYPTAQETLDCITKSTRKYWVSPESEYRLFTFIDKLEPIERAAIVYIGDMYHIYKHNPTQAGAFVKGFGRRSYEQPEMEVCDDILKRADGDVQTLAKLVCSDYLMGKTMGDLKEQEPDKYKEVCHTMELLMAHQTEYKDFITGLLRPEVLNPGANLRSMHGLLREAVLTSDTDSTIFTTQYWVKELQGDIGFTPEHYNIGYTMAFLVNKTVYHQLALMCKNLGVANEELHTLSMKNEYYFPVYTLTNSAKHYFAYKSVREGNVYAKMKLEKKGVELRNSKIPKNVMGSFDKWIMSMMDLIIKNGRIKIDELLEIPYKTEMEVRSSILKSEPTYFQTAQVKDRTSYKQGDASSMVKNHLLWESVFSPQYGSAPILPYVALKISTKLTSKAKILDWIHSMENKVLAKRLLDYVNAEEKSNISTIFIPKVVVEAVGIPKEILEVIDMDKQLMNVTSPFYLALESFGFYIRNSHNSQMIYNYVPNYVATSKYQIAT